jgi:hypothetical protein
MKIPQMPILQDQSKVYSPASGVNLSKLPNEIDDGQNALMLNMWYRDTMLRTRPGLVKEIEQTYGKIVDVAPSDGSTVLLRNLIINSVQIDNKYGIYILTEKALLNFDGTNIERVPTDYTYNAPNFTYIYADFDFSSAHMLLAESFSEEIGYGSVNVIKANNLIISAGNALYQLDVIIKGETLPHLMFLVSLGDTDSLFYWSRITPPHIPVIRTNMHASGAGAGLEARNYITPQVKNEIRTDATSTVYNLSDKGLDTTVGTNVDKSTVQINYNNLSGTVLSFGFANNSTTDIEGGITATLNRILGTITFSTHLVDATSADVPNMTVTYSYTLYASPTPIEKCTIGSWYGGAYQGQTSGNSMFVAGNSNEPNAIYHSAVGDPTYWPDDSVDYVGSPSDPITAFGKDFGKLFILKENSTYEKGFYWDSTSLKQSYPTSEVHVGIGCDMPNSVQLINNNLTWANSKGGVYTVATTNTNNERVIVPISQNINPDLLKNSLADLQAAVSVDDGFYYYLFVGNKVYLWDYNSTAFIDYSDILKAQNRLAWYIWTIPCALTTAFLFGGKVWGASAADNFLYAFDPMQSLDEGGTWFDAWMISKAFDNGLPQFKKQPYYYVFNMACAGVVGIEIQLIDEVDTCSKLGVLEGGDSEAMTSISLRQAMSWGKTYQVAVHRLNGDTGAFAISSYSIKSKIGKEV